MTKYHITYITNETILPNMELVSAVFLIALTGSKILAIENDRGWDIPGGHIEYGETPEEALIREVQEEAGASFSNAKLFAMLGSDDQDTYKDKVMFMYMANNFTLGTFTPSEDAFGRDVIEVKEFFERYTGISELATLVSRAQSVINS
jgi:8-oxo-dGTP diphosphatase